MSTSNDYVDIKRVLKDYLKEQGITLRDLLSVMDEDKRGIMEALGEMVHLTPTQSKALERELPSKDLNLLLFVIQAFYILNPAGIYKGLIIEPAREDIVHGDKVTYEGCRLILKTLNISTQHLNA